MMIVEIEPVEFYLMYLCCAATFGIILKIWQLMKKKDL